MATQKPYFHIPSLKAYNENNPDRFASRRMGVTGAPDREVNSKVATAPKLKGEDKDRVNNSQRIKQLNLISLS